ncbi:MAG: YtxH domain-containing protein [Ferruginibacter sp.]|nr:YtxH domain-containing protein [Chitinophagaceae bacterium]MBP6287375.1 YtxH domain-containing protein [Ferruginibacter sp.]MBU9936685.1 YtxH domain-containing protein [Ferruginibacter sp.]
MKNSSKILVALAAGVAAGAVLGILFAPGKGSDTRKKIVDEGKKMTDDVKHKFGKGMEKLNELKTGLKEKVEEFA